MSDEILILQNLDLKPYLASDSWAFDSRPTERWKTRKRFYRTGNDIKYYKCKVMQVMQ